MHHAVAQKFRVFQRGNHGKHPLLLGEFQIRLKPDQVVRCARNVLLAQLQNGVRALSVLIVQPHGLEHAEAQRIPAARRHDLDGHAPLEDLALFELVRHRTLGGNERVDERLVLLLIHRAVDVIALALAVTVGRERL